ncbi:MAG: Clp protease ClpS [Bacteroidetes bacterium HGW-Bacteroidetes-11]|jgi:ATP-dependent Clp protease adaptor protein ClpS|nr:MAG: Clp protease ClpS [Bacteroidetes bacterium HGW-Bacteroidetes-11]
MVREKSDILKKEKDLQSNGAELVLYNDDINTFDFVIETLIDVCGIDPVQAEQITLIVHYKGKCGVKVGSVIELKPEYNEMINRGLTASIE